MPGGGGLPGGGGVPGEHRKVDVRLPGKGNSTAHGARPVHLIMSIVKWIRGLVFEAHRLLYHSAEEVDSDQGRGIVALVEVDDGPAPPACQRLPGGQIDGQRLIDGHIDGQR